MNASKVKLFNLVRSQLFGDSVDVGLREDHGEATESRSVNDELRLLESQIYLKEVGIRQAEAEAKAKEAEAKAKEAEAEAKEARQGNTNNGNFVRDRRSWTRSPPNGASKFSTCTCSFCGKPGHKAEFCWKRLQPNTGKPAMIITEEANTSPVGVMAGLSKADSIPIALVSTKGEARKSAVSVLASGDFDLFQESFAKDLDIGTFRPFLSQGTVEVDGVETPVTVLRDSGCLQTLIKEGVVAARKTDKYSVLGSLWGQGVAPLALVRVKSSCFSGIANVVCVHELPVAGVDLILGNDLAGGQMENVTPPPVLRERPDSTAELQQLEDDMPGVFHLCAVTRSMLMTNVHNVDDSLSLEGLFANPIASQDISSAVNAVTGRVALIAAQEQVDSLRLSFDQVSDSANDSGPTMRYFITTYQNFDTTSPHHRSPPANTSSPLANTTIHHLPTLPVTTNPHFHSHHLPTPPFITCQDFSYPLPTPRHHLPTPPFHHLTTLPVITC
ncbi:hypothetical protein Hamer_G005561 [Homarus americanus]|uniref:CCHC-type domain-containing protein n=1 Tax=Homarus americanus TaxID=6706 RepID=A0A8J5JXT4_HOMAM|nr:hypothetical protein Hamer_G005561 [Homarus americanus]